MNRRLSYCFLVLAICSLAGVLIYSWRLYTARFGTTIVIENVGDVPLSETTVYYGGGSRFLDTINKDQQAEVRVFPTTDAGLHVSFRAPTGEITRVDVGGYFGPSMSAKVLIRMNGDKIVARQIDYK